MSQAKAVEFLKKIAADADLQAQVRQAEYEALKGVAAKHGFKFSMEDYLGALKETGSTGGGRQLSDEELDMVSGGTGLGACG